MGAGIAQVALAHGHQVTLADSADDALARAKALIQSGLERDVAKGRLSAEFVAAARGNLTIANTTQGFASFARCDLAIEAIVERLEPKQQLMHSLERAVRADCILATNTSSLSVASIAAACTLASRVIGIHFFNPATVMPLVEIVPSLQTAPEVAARARALIDSWRKTTVIAADTPGFIVNRIARPYYGEALRLYEEGYADPSTIDWAMRELGGFKMGPFELMDFIGHDINYVVTESVWTAMYFDPRYRPSLAQRRLVDAGFLGKKTGRGFYDYAASLPAPNPTRDPALGEQIVAHIVSMLINEAIDAVHWRVASPQDIELAMQKGVNYPKGLLAWGNERGPAAVLHHLDQRHAETGDDRYRASPLLRQYVRQGALLPTA